MQAIQSFDFGEGCKMGGFLAVAWKPNKENINYL
jgi:hypothetical protein